MAAAAQAPCLLSRYDRDWQVVGDFDLTSAEEACELAAQHAFGEPLEWRWRGGRVPGS